MVTEHEPEALECFHCFNCGDSSPAHVDFDEAEALAYEAGYQIGLVAGKDDAQIACPACANFLINPVPFRPISAQRPLRAPAA